MARLVGIAATYKAELSTSWPAGSRFCRVLCRESRVFGEHVESSGLGFSVALLSLVCLYSSQAGHVGTAMDILMSDGGLPSCLKHQSFPIHVDTVSGSMDFDGPRVSACPLGKVWASAITLEMFLRLGLHQIMCSKPGAVHMIGMCCNSFCQPILDCITGVGTLKAFLVLSCVGWPGPSI